MEAIGRREGEQLDLARSPTLPPPAALYEPGSYANAKITEQQDA
jgi:hypothetical protein